MTSVPGLLIAASVALYALLSARAAAAAISGPMVFVAVGVALGPPGLGWISPVRDAQTVETLLETALVLVLFADAAALRFGGLRRGRFLPLRLLAIGLPLTLALGTLAAWPLLPGLGFWELALVGTVLAPTDASLSRPAIAEPRVPPLVRQGLNAESGLNDGLAVPFFVIFLAAAAGSGQHGESPGVGEVFVRALLLSTVCGAVLGLLGGFGLARSLRRRWTGAEWVGIVPAAAALASFAAADALHGSGFIAAWVAGLAFAAAYRKGAREPVREAPAAHRALPRVGEVAGLTDQLGALATMLSFFAFGAVLLGPALEELTWRMTVYAVLSLTVVRMLPVALSLLRSGLARPTVAYLAWFGPRGLASLVLGLLVVHEELPGGGQVSAVVAVTVGLSVLAHGVSAGWLAARYGRWYAGAAARAPGAALRESVLPEDEEGEGRPGPERPGPEQPESEGPEPEHPSSGQP
ncbi:cation:proton antiporter [Streptomyces sp. ODS28]|uniref:cation:proton antiporter n=1 Tax=Streptomyces sp. ODS28 TaxID=3136688 RepID=UPI0031E6B7CC